MGTIISPNKIPLKWPVPFPLLTLPAVHGIMLYFLEFGPFQSNAAEVCLRRHKLSLSFRSLLNSGLCFEIPFDAKWQGAFDLVCQAAAGRNSEQARTTFSRGALHTLAEKAVEWSSLNLKL